MIIITITATTTTIFALRLLLTRGPLLQERLVGDVPAVQVSNAQVQVRGEAEPGDVGDVAPAGDAIAEPALGRGREEQPGQVPVQAQQGGDVGQRERGPPRPEEQRHPRQVQPQLRRVERGGAVRHRQRQVQRVCERGDRRRQRERAPDRPVRRVPRHPVQERPHRPEDGRRWSQWRLLQQVVGRGCLLRWWWWRKKVLV